MLASLSTLCAPPTSGSTALALPCPPPAVAALLDFAGGQAALARRHVDAWTDLSGPQRARAQAIVDWLKAVWAAYADMRARGTGSLAAAVADVSLRQPDVGMALLHAGKLGHDARTVHNWESWSTRIGKHPSGEPRWERWRRLVQNYACGSRVTPDDEAFWRDVMKLYLRPEAPPISACYRDAAAVWRGRGFPAAEIPSERTVRSLTRQRVSLSAMERYRGGATVYNARSRGYVIRHCNRAAGEAWFADHRISDFWIRMPHPDTPDQVVPVRPWCTAICDAATGYILAIRLYCHAPNRDSIIETTQGAIFANDRVPPRILYTDQGSDFCAAGLSTETDLRTSSGQPILDRHGEPYRYSILKALRCDHWMSAPYNGKEKPIEGHFGHIALDFDRTMPGYSGRAPQYRPDPQDTYEGDPWRLCSLEQATQRLDAWVRDVYHQARLPTGLARAEAWAARPRHPESALDERSLFFSLLLPQAETRLVRRTSLGRCGIQFDGWTYSHAELLRYQDKPVMVKTYWGLRRESRNGRLVYPGVFVFAPDDTFICAAPAERIVDMFADTAAAQAALGEVQHLINAIAAKDRDCFQAATGLTRLTPRDRSLQLMSGDADGREAPTVQIAEGVGNHRRLPAAEPLPHPHPAPESPADAADLARAHAAITAAFRRDDESTEADPEPARAWLPAPEEPEE